MKKFLKIHQFLFTLTFLLLEACNPGIAPQTSQVPSRQSTIPVTVGLTPSPSPTISPPLSSTPVTTPSRTPMRTLLPTSTSLPPTPLAATSIEPIKKGADIWIDSWSPDGLWLGFWLWTPEDLAIDFSAPPAKLIFHNPHSDEICEYADFLFSEHTPQIYWQPDGRAAVYQTGSYWIGFPCQDFVPVQVEEIEFLEPSDETQSPEGTFRAETNLQDSDGKWDKLRTTITNNTTGQEENRVDWEIDVRLGSWDEYLGGKWVTDDLFLIYETRDKGPLLIQAGGEIIQVAPDLFDVPAPIIPQDSSDWVNLRAFATSVDNDNLYHILLHGVGSEARFPPVRLFHSDTGEVETLPYTHLWHPGFTPDGRWILLDAHPDIDGYESYALWVRPVDPPSSQMRLFADGTYWSAWSPNLSEIAFGWTGEFTVFRFPNSETVKTWTTGQYSNHRLVWSPTADFLATSGNIPGEYEAAIFVVDVRE